MYGIILMTLKLTSSAMNALKDCSSDVREHNKHYIPVALPFLPFKDNHDLLLSSHFLPIYVY
ncbi:hypothetical protein J2Z64_004421 [Oceanobacillus polygoni]|uniref:Uncharacterized protein n=1 Tax=Oceanobacillus polygoni TaxID=1235259 RepID=A0A9X1CDT0_9BACI|nr:hypothetical protein [Oceanobacillus polygoni]